MGIKSSRNLQEILSVRERCGEVDECIMKEQDQTQRYDDRQCRASTHNTISDDVIQIMYPTRLKIKSPRKHG